MTVYRLRDKDTQEYYKGNGNFSTKGNIYSSKGHIKNSINQTCIGNKTSLSRRRLEIVTYELTELKTEDI